ncbi:MAG TPA: LppP/LprE family lipoprotein [Conexibacter sp.]|nr:LppP/LprE family lipoprotein [Conexibacter sp.]
MPSRRRILSVLAPAALVLPVLAGCGGGDAHDSAVTVVTRTVTDSVTTPAATATTGSTTTATQPPPDPNAPLSLQTAEQTLSARGYAPLGERDWRPDQPLKVLLGVSRSASPRAELAFFFVGDRFIGTDTKDPSAQLQVAAQGGDAVTIAYGLYRPSDSIDDPTAGTAQVTYRWNGGSLVPQGAIPSAAPDASPSRR